MPTDNENCLSNRISGRPLAEADLAARVEWFNDSRVQAQMSLPKITLESTTAWFKKLQDNNTRADFAFDDASGTLVAMGGLTDIHPGNLNGELYIIVDPEKTGSGIGTKAMEWICNWGFSKRNLHKIYLHTREKNERARRLYSRLGFKQEGVLRQHVLYEGAFEDRHLQSLLASEWKQCPWSSKQ